MKILMTTAAAMMFATAAFAQSTTTTPMDATQAGTYPGNTGAVENGAANNTTAAPTAGGAMTAEASATTAMSVKGGKWMVGDRKATKTEIAEWKKNNPGMTQPQ